MDLLRQVIPTDQARSVYYAATSKLLRHFETRHPGLKDKPPEYFERKKQEHQDEDGRS